MLAACQLASAAVAARDIKPVLRNLKASVDDDGKYTLMATDLEIGIRLAVEGVNVSAVSLTPGVALWPTARLISILRESTDAEISLTATDATCTVRGSSGEFSMPSDDADAFPDVPEFTGEDYHTLHAGELREMIRRTSFAAAAEGGVRFGATTGILWELADGGGSELAALIATDGRRLAKATGAFCQRHGTHSIAGKLPVVPAKAMSLLERNIASLPEDAEVRVKFSGTDVLFAMGGATIHSRLVEGRFPAYKQIIPANKHIVTLHAGQFASAIRQAAIMTDEESKRVRFGFSKNTLTLKAQGASSGSSSVQMPVEYKGPALEISFDPKFLLAFLKAIAPDAPLQIELADHAKPALLRCGDNYIYVIVPLVETA